MRKLSDIKSTSAAPARSAQAPVPVSQPETAAEPVASEPVAPEPVAPPVFHPVDATEGVALTITWGAPLLLAAAHFASTDSAKDRLTHICIRKEGDRLWIGSTDGYRAFRTTVPLDGKQLQAAMPFDELRLNAKVLRKSCVRARSIVIKDNAIHLLDRLGQPIEIRPDALVPSGQWNSPYPNLDQLWPQTFSYSSGGAIGMNAVFLKEMAQAIEKIDAAYDGTGVCKLRFNERSNPLTLNAGWFPDEDHIEVELLLMPVQIRDNGDREAIDVPPQPANAEG